MLTSHIPKFSLPMKWCFLWVSLLGKQSWTYWNQLWGLTVPRSNRVQQAGRSWSRGHFSGIFPHLMRTLTVSYCCLPAATPPCALYFCATQTSKINMFASTEKLMDFSINVTDKTKSRWEMRFPVWKWLCMIRALCNIPVRLLGGLLLIQSTFRD